MVLGCRSASGFWFLVLGLGLGLRALFGAQSFGAELSGRGCGIDWVGRRGWVRGTRCKYVLVSSTAASMRQRVPRTHPRRPFDTGSVREPLQGGLAVLGCRSASGFWFLVLSLGLGLRWRARFRAQSFGAELWRRCCGVAWLGRRGWVRGTRCKYVLVSSTAASMRQRVPQTHPRRPFDTGSVRALLQGGLAVLGCRSVSGFWFWVLLRALLAWLSAVAAAGCACRGCAGGRLSWRR